MVIPRSRSSGALSIPSNATALPPQASAHTRVSAAVRVVLPWSTWPMVPTFTCGLFRSNFAFAIVRFPVSKESLLVLRLHLAHDLFRLALRHFVIVREFHRVHGAPLRH